ncbi:hypothetical protein ECDEC6D_0056 [Escherichia coli DEC6D]|nr:hypothetical protein ECDEC6C_5260 [Escherichia coli DEC6C]EHV78829.1 hypothetical protein ECDEC6D_0056 [Escherichia coli DEC6D]
MAAWRYASQDYRTFSDHLYENDKHYHQSDYNDFYDIGRKIAFLPILCNLYPIIWEMYH